PSSRLASPMTGLTFVERQARNLFPFGWPPVDRLDVLFEHDALAVRLRQHNERIRRNLIALVFFAERRSLIRNVIEANDNRVVAFRDRIDTQSAAVDQCSLENSHDFAAREINLHRWPIDGVFLHAKMIKPRPLPVHRGRDPQEYPLLHVTVVASEHREW